ncbi:hypothetical protein QM588_09210 [Rhodococcus sp. IEGM 1354]|uniref:hypothetical protein n=1 Tax=Rhodococcus sp. IEGM 1354 TaxID=3047088 RepID=UPI0024B7419F|nr:hypothetical protein [Rhodococcus sp. IEGM 1354]MDI9930579.1 hypothetical protein [Rhodococcus sp. IEGM 1354]
MNPITITGRDVARGINDHWNEGVSAESALPVFTSAPVMVVDTSLVSDGTNLAVVQTPVLAATAG